MNGPNELNGAPQQVAVSGGKALARLNMLLYQRGISSEGITQETAAQAPTPAGAGAAGAASQYLEAAINAATSPPNVAAPGAAPLAWRSIGPTDIPNGQTYGGNRIPVSGRVSSIAVDPSDPAHLLVGSAGGGIWESHDDGGAWLPRTDDMPTLAIGAIAFNPANSLIVLAGSGEGNALFLYGVGVYRSADGGSTWRHLASHPFVGEGFYDIAFVPGDGSTVLAATNKRLARSTDGGASWAKVLPGACFDLSVALVGETVEALAACKDGVHRSLDGGATWTKIIPLTLGRYDRAAVCHAPSNPAVAYVFALSTEGPSLYRRSAVGGAFVVERPLPADLKTKQAWYDWYVAVSPEDADSVCLGAIDIHKGHRVAGGTWVWTNISTKPTATGSIHPDQHALAFSPHDADVLYAGCDGGLYRSDDEGATWTSLNKGLGITEFEYIAGHPTDPDWIIGGTQDNGTLINVDGVTWDHSQDGDGGDCGVEAGSPDNCYHTFYYISLERSADSGGSWTTITPGTDPDALFYPPFDVNGSTIAIAGNTVFISNDRGGTWNRTSLPSGVASALCVRSRDAILVATVDGRCYMVERTAAGTYVPRVLTSPVAAWISDLELDPHDANVFWATCSVYGPGHVFRTDDGGVTWSDKTSNLPDLPVNAITADPMDSNHVFIGCDVGVYETVDGGASWTLLGTGLPNAIVGDLSYQAFTKRLRAGTRSRGVWELQLP